MKVRLRSYFKLSLSLAIALLAAQSAFAQGVNVDAKPYPKVTDERLEHPAAGDWLMYRRTYDGSGYSPLNQITPSNIHQLTLAWSVSTDLLGAHETTVIVNHGRMFITTPQNNIIAFDDKTGCYSTLAPLAVRGKIIAGYSGGELGVRGSVSAFDALTGKRIWKTYTVPAANEPGGDTWKGEAYKRGGGSTWITGVYDPASNTTYWGTGNPGPWVADDRPGDNLYTDSTLALDADTGKLKSYHQYT